MDRQSKDALKLVATVLGILMAIFIVFYGIHWLTFRKEPCRIVSMTWQRTKTIEERRVSYSSYKDSNGYRRTRENVYWYTIDRKSLGGGRTDEPKWPDIRKAGYHERERRTENYYILGNSKIDNEPYQYTGHSMGSWLRYDIQDEVLMGISYWSSVWSVEPYRME